MEQGVTKKVRNMAVVAVNVICVIIMVILFMRYDDDYYSRLRAQNIADISNLNHSAAKIAQAAFDNRGQSLRDTAQYIHVMGFSRDEALDYIYRSNSGHSGTLELVGKDSTGYAVIKDVAGSYLPVSYENNSYSELKYIFEHAAPGGRGAVSYTPEFTDAVSAFNSFAFYTTISVTDESGQVACYTLMDVVQTDDFIDMLRQEGGYDRFSTVLMDRNGNYIIGDTDFKSSNFFKYIYVFNSLTLDERNVLQKYVQDTSEGALTYSNSRGEDCIFAYCKLSGGDQYSVSCVPVSSFRNTEADRRYITYITVVLCVMLVVDILWLDLLNRRLRESAAHEREANAAKTDFLSRMSHDMRTPLNAILGFTEITRQDPSLPEPLRENVDKISLSGHYLLGLINDVLDMSKIESGKIELHEETLDATKMLGDIAEVFGSEAAMRGVSLRTQFDTGDMRFVVMDPLRTKQIYSNLISNAVKFSDAGGEVLWSVKAEKSGDGYDVVSVVQDSGCGMSGEFMGHLFEPFTQEHNSHSGETTGTGLGLAIVKRLTDLMGGTVEVQSELKKGTSFTVKLHWRAGVPQKAGDSGEQDAAETPLEGKRVLVCEDNEMNRQIAVMLLQSRGMLAETAENGSAGVEAFRNSPVRYYDAVLMDIRMPVMNGLEAAKAIRALPREDAGLPIIAMTANAYDEDVRSSAEAGMDAHLAKPVDPPKLFETLAKLMAAAEKAR